MPRNAPLRAMYKRCRVRIRHHSVVYGEYANQKSISEGRHMQYFYEKEPAAIFRSTRKKKMVKVPWRLLFFSLVLPSVETTYLDASSRRLRRARARRMLAKPIEPATHKKDQSSRVSQHCSGWLLLTLASFTEPRKGDAEIERKGF